MLDLDQLLRHAVERGASDVHIKVGSPPFIRVDGRLERTENASISPVETERIASWTRWSAGSVTARFVGYFGNWATMRCRRSSVRAVNDRAPPR